MERVFGSNGDRLDCDGSLYRGRTAADCVGGFPHLSDNKQDDEFRFHHENEGEGQN